ncbi:acyltransferase [Gammaproteobacteria bacterium]|nr:acyltransferase [Gammaproteobacteria bacterium]MDC0130162.1 acyltransferase [Gammaproteobacteria bacterium]
MKYRPEIDGLRALAVMPVILFHASFEWFSGGFVGVDVFFVISGYLITLIIIEELNSQSFSITGFYERRARRILPALFTMLTATTIFSYFILFPSDLEEYAKSLISVIFFVSNIFFWRSSDYFATEAELTPLLHTWSLAVEEQFYLLFPIFLVFVWRFGRDKAFWIIVCMTAISLLLSEWGWRNTWVANFYLAPSRAWELLAGSIAAFIVSSKGVQQNNILSLLGLSAIIFSIFFYDKSTPFPSAFTLVPVLGTVFLVLYADKGTLVGKLLSIKAFVSIGLISYSAYLWHQPILALYRRVHGVELNFLTSSALILLTLFLSTLTWKFIETPFRNKKKKSKNFILISSVLSASLIVAFSSILLFTDGGSYRYDLSHKPIPWSEVKCHGAKRIAKYENPLSECLGDMANEASGDIYLLGDSHAAQLTFTFQSIADARGVKFYFINTENSNDFPYSFWRRSVLSDRILDYMLNVLSKDDYLLVSFHRGHFNPHRDSHFNLKDLKNKTSKAEIFTKNFLGYMERFKHKNINIILIKDGPLLNDKDTSVEGCMYTFVKLDETSCMISLAKDNVTRSLQSSSFDTIASKFNFIKTIDYLPELYTEGYFSPISPNAEYLMIDRHHLSENAALSLAPFFSMELN